MSQPTRTNFPFVREDAAPAYEDVVLVERGEGVGAEDGDEERVGGARGVVGDAGEQGHGAVGGEA
jgi:hypothetical protein